MHNVIWAITSMPVSWHSMHTWRKPIRAACRLGGAAQHRGHGAAQSSRPHDTGRGRCSHSTAHADAGLRRGVACSGNPCVTILPGLDSSGACQPAAAQGRCRSDHDLATGAAGLLCLALAAVCCVKQGSGQRQLATCSICQACIGSASSSAPPASCLGASHAFASAGYTHGQQRRPCSCTDGLMHVAWQLSSMLGERLLGELDARALVSDAIERTLGREAENGRLLRLLMRLSFVHERPRPDASSDWSDTGAPGPAPLLHRHCSSSWAQAYSCLPLRYILSACRSISRRQATAGCTS